MLTFWSIMINRRIIVSQEEKQFIFRLVCSNKFIIENKKTDSVTTAQKKKKWLEICEEYNKVPKHNKKTVEQIKKVWDNEKTRRKKAIDEKRKILCTDGEHPATIITWTPVINESQQVDIKLKDAVLDSDTVFEGFTLTTDNFHNLNENVEGPEKITQNEVSYGFDSDRKETQRNNDNADMENSLNVKRQAEVLGKESALKVKRMFALIKQERELHECKKLLVKKESELVDFKKQLMQKESELKMREIQLRIKEQELKIQVLEKNHGLERK